MLLSPRAHNFLSAIAETAAVLAGAFGSFALSFYALIATGVITKLTETGALIIAVCGIVVVSGISAVIACFATVYVSRRVPARCRSCRARAFRVSSRPPMYRCRGCGATTTDRRRQANDEILDAVRDRVDATVKSLVERGRTRDAALKAGAQEGTLTMPPPEERQGSVALARDAGQVSLPPKK